MPAMIPRAVMTPRHRMTTPKYFPMTTCQRAMGLDMRVSMVRFSISSSMTLVEAKTMIGSVKIKVREIATSRYILKSSFIVK